MTGPELLASVGRALYGPYWQNALARALDINERTVRRWARGDGLPSPGVWIELRQLLATREAELRDLQSKLPVA